MRAEHLDRRHQYIEIYDPFELNYLFFKFRKTSDSRRMDQSSASITDSLGVDFRLPASYKIALHSAVGIRREDLAASTLESAATSPAWSRWQDALRDQLGANGLLVQPAEMSLSEACENARPRAPLITWTAGSGWLALFDSRAGRVLVSRPDVASAWMSEGDLQAAFDLQDAGTIHSWFVLESTLFPHPPTPAEPASALDRLLAIARTERTDVLAILLYAAFAGLLGLAIPIAVQQLVNTVAFGGLAQPVVVLAILLMFGLAVAAAMSAFQSYLAELLQQRFFARACLDLAHRLPRAAPDAFGAQTPTAYVNRFFDLVTIQKTGARLLLEGSAVLLQTSAGLLVLSFYHPLMLALSVFLFASMAIVALLFGRGAPRTAQRESSAKYAIAAWMEELVRHRPTFRTTAGRRYAESHADSLVAHWVNARRQHYRLVFRQFTAALALQVVVNTGLLALGGFLVVAGELTLGQLVASEIIVASVVASFTRLAKHFESYYDLLAAVDKVGGLFDLELETQALGETETPRGRAAAIVSRALSMTSGDRPILENSSFEFQPGESVAISAASTVDANALIDVLAGIEYANGGSLTIDGNDLRELTPESIHNQIRLIRSPRVIPESLLANVTIGSTDATLDQVKQALESVGLLQEIRQLPDGLKTSLSESGAPLNRNQLMRLEFARVLLDRPSLVLLDPDTACLDEQEMEPAIDALFDPHAPWTLVSTASSPGIISRCQRMMLLAEGDLLQTQASAPSPTSPGDPR